MDTMLKEDQEEAGAWLGLIVLMLFILVAGAVKSWPLEEKDYTDAGLGCIDCLDTVDDCGE